MKFITAIIFTVMVLASSRTWAEVLETASFTIVITHPCEEGCVSCENIRYTGVSKKTGLAVSLTGKTVHTMDADGVTPNKFLGYSFTKDKTTYFVGKFGILTVSRGRKILVEEQGKWLVP